MTIDDSGTPMEPDTTNLTQVALADIERGVSLLEAQDWSGAAKHFSAALQLLPPQHEHRRADAYVGLAEAHVGREQFDEALFCYEQAIHAHPTHEDSIRRALEISAWTDRYGLTIDLRRRLLALPISQEDRVELLTAMVQDSVQVAISALEGLRGQDVPGIDVLDRLRAAHEAAGDPAGATDVVVAQAGAMQPDDKRAAAMTRAAEYCAARAQDTPRAVALYEAAIAADPTACGAFEAIERVLTQQSSFRELEKAYQRQAERLEKAGAVPEHAALLGRLASLRNEELHDRKGAIDALSRRVELEPTNVEAIAALAMLLDSDGNVERACRTLETLCWHAPMRGESYHALFRMYSRAKQQDRAYQSSAALVHLGEAGLNEQMLYQQYRPEGGLDPRDALDDSDWDELYPSEHLADVRTVLEVIGPVAIAHRVATQEKAGRLRIYSAKTHHDPETSTETAVQSIRWAAKVIGAPLPEIHVLHDSPISLSALQTRHPAMALGKSLLSGRTAAELAFLIGRELTYFRPEHRVLVYYPSSELTTLMKIAIRMSNPQNTSPTSHRDRELVETLEKTLDMAEWERVRAAVKHAKSSGQKIDMRRYVRSLDIAASRVGLLLAGDLPTAGKLLSTDVREVEGLRAIDRMRDLLPFAVSEPYAKLRAKLGLVVG